MTSANLRLLDKSAGVTGVGSGDLLGIKDVKSIIKSGKSKCLPTGKLPHLLAASNRRELNPG
jgi:hypothetical protein